MVDVVVVVYETAFSGLNVPLRFFEFIMGRGSGRGVIDVGILRGQVCSFGGAILGASTAPKFMNNIKNRLSSYFRINLEITSGSKPNQKMDPRLAKK